MMGSGSDQFCVLVGRSESPLFRYFTPPVFFQEKSAVDVTALTKGEGHAQKATDGVEWILKLF